MKRKKKSKKKRNRELGEQTRGETERQEKEVHHRCSEGCPGRSCDQGAVDIM